MRATGLLLSILLSFCVISLNATTIHVPADQPTIQAGIDTAVDGDTVLVADGTYTGDDNKNLNFYGKAIVVMSENGAESCLIDCEGSGRGFYFGNGEDSNSVVQGFTIQNGYVYGIWPWNCGGAILCNGSSPTITGNTILGNTCAYQGGGISCWDSSPTITDNTISGNVSLVGGGADGGGIRCYASTPTITGNTIVGNVANNGSGGGIAIGGSSVAVITGNTIIANTALAGGGLTCQTGTSRIENNTVSGNTGFWDGGVFLYYETSIISHNIITNNTADSLCGGIDFMYSSATMSNNTIAENYSPDWGGGMVLIDSCMVTITNTISWNNDALTGYGIWIGYYDTTIPSTLTICYSDVEGGQGSVFVDEGCTLNWLTGMIDEDPLFVLPEKRDCRLLWESPCIDAGHPSPQYYDPDGTICDMGAYCFDQNDYLTLYVTPDMEEVTQGGQLGVTYTAINRWDQPKPFWVLSRVLLTVGSTLNVLGPNHYTLPADYTAQFHITHPVPNVTPTGIYEYRSLIGMPPGTLYDNDSFKFRVVE